MHGGGGEGSKKKGGGGGQMHLYLFEKGSYNGANWATHGHAWKRHMVETHEECPLHPPCIG